MFSFFRNLRREAFFDKYAEALSTHWKLDKLVMDLVERYPDGTEMPHEECVRMNRAYQSEMEVRDVLGRLDQEAEKLGVDDEQLTAVMRRKGLAEFV